MGLREGQQVSDTATAPTVTAAPSPPPTADRHGWRGPHQWTVTGRRDHANGNSTIRFHCPCGARRKFWDIPTAEADDLIAEYLRGDR